MNQHQRFTHLHSTDSFAKKYMTWLVHHEFGSDHRPFRFNENKPQSGDPSTLEYWLEVWTNVYTYISDHLPNNAHLICYESLCNDDDLVWNKLVEKINIGPYQGTLTFSGSFKEISYSSTNGIFKLARELYNHLLEKSFGYE
jgi:hypothetical protein